MQRLDGTLNVRGAFDYWRWVRGLSIERSSFARKNLVFIDNIEGDQIVVVDAASGHRTARHKQDVPHWRSREDVAATHPVNGGYVRPDRTLREADDGGRIGDVQRLAEQLLKGKDGAVVAIDPWSGDVIAMASSPAFDPNLFARGITEKEYRALIDNPRRPLFNRTLRAQLPSGSTIKPAIALGALTDGGFSPFTQKGPNPQAAGAAAVGVANNNSGAPFAMGGSDPSITIPAAMISQSDGATIRDGLPAAGTSGAAGPPPMRRASRKTTRIAATPSSSSTIRAVPSRAPPVA